MATHSDKALTTIAQMGTTPEQWALAPIKWVKEERMVKGWVTCPECLGARHCRYDSNGAVIPIPKVSPNSMHFSPDAVAQREYIALARKESTNPYAGTYGTCRKCSSKGYSTGNVVGKVLRMVDVGYPQWPAGTKFDSRFRVGCNCNLCNKLIMKSNMVPVLAKDANGDHHGMWVGQDCSKKFLATKPPKKFGDESFFIAAFEE